ncbi:MAG: type II toxin-antitoxin system RelE/ParE family toxin [Burkholderiaceae bacterium]
MTRAVRFSEAATEEFVESAQYYQDKVYGLGDAFQAEIHQLALSASEHPERYPIVGTDVRRAVAKRFPFSLYFRVYESEIFVFSVFHGRRNPKIWQDRT